MTLVAVYFLILVGGIVRATGSGMGCPDWPKCFGLWIPPSSESQLPPDYKQHYTNYRHEKNIRFAAMLDMLGLKNKADRIRNDRSIESETGFNTAKTWMEYLNRLTGTVTGFLVLLNFIATLPMMKANRKLFLLSGALLILVTFQGWIGSVVVSTHLVPWMVTVHMILAMVIVALLLYLIFLSRREEFENRMGFTSNRWVRGFIFLSLFLLGIQVVLGTQVREMIDVVAASLNYQARALWISRAGLSFLVHRSFSLLVLACQGALIYFLLKKQETPKAPVTIVKLLIGFTLAEMILGAVMAYAGIPAMVQPVHLLIAVLLFGAEFVLMLASHNKKTIHA